jgi:hypothetical protein
MKRRSMSRVLCLAAVVVGMAGCETLRSRVRPDDDNRGQLWGSDDVMKPKGVDSDPSKIMSVDSDSQNPKPFFSGDRRSGGWSSEARQIERDLNVN